MPFPTGAPSGSCASPAGEWHSGVSSFSSAIIITSANLAKSGRTRSLQYSGHAAVSHAPASPRAAGMPPRAHCDLTRRNCSSRPCHVVSRNAPLPRRPASCKASNFFLAHRGPSRDAGRAAPPRPRSFTASLHNFGVAARPWLALWLPRVKGIHSLGDQTVLHYSMETSSLARKVQSRGLSMACTLRLGVPCSSSSHNCFRLAPRDAGMASAFKPWAKVAPASGNPDAGAACPCPACPARPSLATRSPTRSPGALPLSNGSSSCSECLVSVGHRSRAFALRHA